MNIKGFKIGDQVHKYEFDETQNRPKYNGVEITSETNIPEVKSTEWDAKANKESEHYEFELTGEFIQLPNVDTKIYKVDKVFGNTNEQGQHSVVTGINVIGKNLLPDAIYDDEEWYDDSEWVPTQGEPEAIIDEHHRCIYLFPQYARPGESFAVSFDFSEEFPDELYLCKCQLSDDEEDPPFDAELCCKFTDNGSVVRDSFSYVEDDSAHYLRIGIGNSSTLEEQIAKIHFAQLEIGETGTEYEPYYFNEAISFPSAVAFITGNGQSHEDKRNYLDLNKKIAYIYGHYEDDIWIDQEEEIDFSSYVMPEWTNRLILPGNITPHLMLTLRSNSSDPSFLVSCNTTALDAMISKDNQSNKTDDMTNPVGIDEDGKLWSSGGGISDETPTFIKLGGDYDIGITLGNHTFSEIFSLLTEGKPVIASLSSHLDYQKYFVAIIHGEAIDLIPFGIFNLKELFEVGIIGGPFLTISSDSDVFEWVAYDIETIDTTIEGREVKLLSVTPD